MEEVIRQGALRLLTSEASCDVILSCSGQRLKAHKVILSIASPLLQTILLEEKSTPAVIVIPEIQITTMTLLLDYIYTGSVHIPQENIKDFLDAASLLKIHIYEDTKLKLNFFKYLDVKDFSKTSKSIPIILEQQSEINKIDRKLTSNKIEKELNIKRIEEKLKMNKSEEEKPLKKTLRKVPNLLPISAVKSTRTTYSHVIPSPWRPRMAPLLGDPRINKEFLQTHKDINDTNNNSFQIMNYAKINDKNNILGFNQSVISTYNSERCQLKINEELKIDDSSKTDQQVSNKSQIDIEINEKEIQIKTNEECLNQSEKKSINDTQKDICNVNNDSCKPLKPFKCEECGKSFSQLRNFKYHRSIHEGTKEFSARCPECGKIFNDKGYLSSHMKIHRDRKEYGCPHCPKRFNQRVAYNMHLRIHTGVKPHECTICGKTFSRKMLLKQHQRVHTGERPYSCPECGKTFADRSNMSLHARLHTGVKPYSCNLCSKSFTKKHHLKTHMNFHTGLKPYSCQKCGLSFSQSSNMRTHYKKCILKAPEGERS